jgi:ribosomal protein L37AE/L43A
VEVVEKSVGELFADIGTEIASIKKRVEELTVESAAPQPIAPRDSMKSDIFSEDKGVGGQKSEIPGSSEPHDQESQKTCPMCGGRMNFHSKEKMWLCYSCAYEELNEDGAQVKSEVKSEQRSSPKPVPAPEQIWDPSPHFAVPLASMTSNESQKSKKGSSPSGSKPSGKKKPCPVCHKKMDWYETEKAWRCRFCDYERRI